MGEAIATDTFGPGDYEAFRALASGLAMLDQLIEVAPEQLDA